VNPFTVTWQPQTLQDLAQIWLDASNRQQVTQATAEIDRRLARDPLGEGQHLHEGLYRIIEGPLTVFYSVDENARLVRVTDVR
jgi:hypothetical protein